jgi:hypothetical protein
LFTWQQAFLPAAFEDVKFVSIHPGAKRFLSRSIRHTVKQAVRVSDSDTVQMDLEGE